MNTTNTTIFRRIAAWLCVLVPACCLTKATAMQQSRTPAAIPHSSDSAQTRSVDKRRTNETVPDARLRPVLVESVRQTTTDVATQRVAEITPVEMARLRGQTLGDVLKTLPGITLLQTGPSIAKPVVRGLHSQRVLVVNAGVQQEGQQWGAEHAPEIDPFAPAKIEVLRGAAGVEYGAGAIGGAIRIVPRTLPHETDVRGEANINLFSNNMQGAASVMAEGAGIGAVLPPNFSWRVQGSARKAGDARTAEYVLGNTGFTELNGSMMLGYSAERFSVQAYYALFTTELGIFRGSHIGNASDLLRAIERGRPFVDYSFSYDIRPPKQQITHDLWSVKASYDAPSLGIFELQYGWQQNNRSEFDAHNARIGDSALLPLFLSRPAMGLQLTTYSLDVKFKHKPAHGFSGVLGVSGMTQGNVRTGRVFLIPNFRAITGGVYAIENYAAGNWILNAGARVDGRFVRVFSIDSQNIPDTTQVFTGVSGAFGALWYPAGAQNPAWSISCNVGSAWRAPSVNEQFSNDVHHGTAQFEIGDAALQPERSYSADVTLNYAGSVVQAELSAYINALDNFIILMPDIANPTVTIRGTFPTFRYRQTQALMRGIDGKCDVRLTESLSVGASLSMIRGDNVSTNEPLIFMPADRARVLVRVAVPNMPTGNTMLCEVASTFVRRQDRFPVNADYAPPPAGYVLFDATLSAEIAAWSAPVRISLSAYNLLNTGYRDYLSRYRYFADDLGRNIVLRFALPFGVAVAE
jgi:iron complex outermembrane recepter protein